MPNLGKAKRRARKPKQKRCGCCLGPDISDLRSLGVAVDDAPKHKPRKKKSRIRYTHMHRFEPFMSELNLTWYGGYAVPIKQCIVVGCHKQKRGRFFEWHKLNRARVEIVQLR